jgi:hypothetical protein
MLELLGRLRRLITWPLLPRKGAVRTAGEHGWRNGLILERPYSHRFLRVSSNSLRQWRLAQQATGDAGFPLVLHPQRFCCAVQRSCAMAADSRKSKSDTVTDPVDSYSLPLSSDIKSIGT